MKFNLFHILKGAGMGMAEVVPGVSGGTIAFITGIYEELISSIRAINMEQVQLLFRGKWSEVWSNINGTFLLQLALGMAVGIVFGVLVLSHLIEEFPEVLWAFFFGLILASAFYVLSLLKKRTAINFFWILVSSVLAFFITELTPAEGSSHLLVVFASGIIAVSALLLPGLSGSFILLVLGMYTIVLGNAKSVIESLNIEAITTLLVFGAGCVIGLLLFSRFLVFLFKNYKEPTLAVLSGFMLGSLNKIWPWREAVLWLNEEGTIVKDPLLVQESWRVLQEVKVLPQSYTGEPYIIWAIIAFFLGIGIVLGLWKASPSKVG